MGESVKILTKAELNIIGSSPLIHQASHLILEGMISPL